MEKYKNKKLIFGIDLGGITAKCGFADEDGTIIDRFVVKTLFGDKVIPYIAEETFKYCKKNGIDWNKQVIAIGFGCCGPIDEVNGISINAGKMGWYNFPARDEAMKYFKNKPIYMLNDSRCATYGEWKQGAGKKYKSFLCLTIGTGVGGGLVLDNKLYKGAHNTAGEFGHGGQSQFDKECPCGLPYCMEGLSSAIGIEWWIDKQAMRNPDSSLGMLKLQLGRKLTIKDCSKLILSGDIQTTNALRYTLRSLAVVISMSLFIIDPEAILIGGGPSALGQPLLDAIHYWLKQFTWNDILKKFDLALCHLGNDAGLVGIIEYACDNHFKRSEK